MCRQMFFNKSVKFLAIISSNNFSAPSSLLLLGGQYSVEWRAVASSFLGLLLPAQNHHLTSQNKGNGVPVLSAVPCPGQSLHPTSGGWVKEGSLHLLAIVTGSQPQRQVAKGKMRKAYILRLLRRQPSNWELGKGGALCSCLHQSGEEFPSCRARKGGGREWVLVPIPHTPHVLIKFQQTFS